MKVDCLIINPSALSQIYQDLSNDLAAIEPPIWAGLLANHVRVKGHSVELLDCEGEGLTVPETVRKVAGVEPRLTVIMVYGQQPSASTQNMFAASILCTALKNAYPERKILLLGGHVSALPARTILEEQADFVGKGEGPSTVIGLLKIKMNDRTEYRKVPGLWWREDGKAVSGLIGQKIAQERLADELPGMAWDLLPMKNYRAHNWHTFGRLNERNSYAALYTSLGCPYKCTFCCINAPFGSSGVRYWSPDFMIGQFDWLAETHGVKNIKIADEMFILNKSHFLKLANLIAERQYGFNIWAYARVDTVRPEYLEALKKAGVNWLALGIESGSRFVRDGVGKGNFNPRDIAGIVHQIKQAGINVIGNYIFGLPDDDERTMNETLELSLNLNCEMSNFYSAMAYPGSPLYNMALAKKWELPEGWLGYSQHSYECLPLRTAHVSAGEVLRFRDEAFNKYFSNSSYLNLIRNKFGEDALTHIQDMTKHRLKRKHIAS